MVGAAKKLEEQHVDGKADDPVEDADQLAEDCLGSHVPIACNNEELGKKDYQIVVFHLRYSYSWQAGNILDV